MIFNCIRLTHKYEWNEIYRYDNRLHFMIVFAFDMDINSNSAKWTFIQNDICRQIESCRLKTSQSFNLTKNWHKSITHVQLFLFDKWSLITLFCWTENTTKKNNTLSCNFADTLWNHHSFIHSFYFTQVFFFSLTKNLIIGYIFLLVTIIVKKVHSIFYLLIVKTN